MRHARPLRVALLALAALAAPQLAAAQGTADDYARALSLEERYEGLVVNVADEVRWLGDTNRFTFRRSTPGGYEFLVMDAETGREREAFDHARLAAGLAAAGGEAHEPGAIPIRSWEFVDGERAVAVEVGTGRWRCDLADYRCAELESRGARRGGGFGSEWSRPAPAAEPVASPDGRLEALVSGHNVVVRRAGSDEVVYRSHDGTEGNAYSARSLRWSPDSRRLAAYRVVPGYQRVVHYVESSPASQLQPLHHTLNYTKPGDVLEVEQPVLFDVEAGTQVEVDRALFPNAYSLSPLQWREDGRELTFEYNQRGHTLYRVIGVDAETGRARTIIDEDPETFFYYSDSSRGGKRFRHDVADGREIVWMSERDGWSHLYLYDGRTGRVKNQITRGEWVVRDVVHVDEDNRQIYFAASGMNPGQDPYFVHFYRVGFDGRGLVPLTEADGTHTISFSPDRRYYVTSWSRVDLPDVTQLRRTADRSLVAELGRGDHSALLAAGWRPPEPFVAKGRDGVTDIWGVIIRPSNFDPAKKYAVVESIYAGPHSNHVPKSFTVFPSRGMLPQAELGFIVVQIDGMGTSNRSKAFHDVAWKNLKDAGFPDRILWHRAVAERYPWYDLSRVGIYGGSAGGQNAMGALLFHGDFYHAAVADNGCHDNRMDKIWWNELWMSWPLGPHYSESSNVDNAWRLRGRLLLTVSELDTNVDPSSTFQVVDALIKAGKDFDFVFLPGGGHARGPYHERKRFDFFVEHLLGQQPPERNAAEALTTAAR